MEQEVPEAGPAVPEAQVFPRHPKTGFLDAHVDFGFEARASIFTHFLLAQRPDNR